MKSIFRRKTTMAFLLLLLITAILLFVNWAISNKITKSYFASKNLYNNNFSQIEKIAIEENQDIELYFAPNKSSSRYILYIAGSSGVLPNIINSKLLDNNLFILEYPKNKQLQNFKDLTNILSLALNKITNKGIKLKDLILLGEGIGGNIALSYSYNELFKSILMINILADEKRQCISSFTPILCKITKSSFSLTKENNNLIYFFFSAVKPLNQETEYSLFNLINANNKFLFSISGKKENFNFNRIMEFYNSTLLQDRMLENEEYNEDQMSEQDFIDLDGLLNPEEYID